MQLDDLSRGFSFKSKRELKYDYGTNERSAKKVLNSYSSKDLMDIIKNFGEEKKPQKYLEILLERDLRNNSYYR